VLCGARFCLLDWLDGGGAVEGESWSSAFRWILLLRLRVVDACNDDRYRCVGAGGGAGLGGSFVSVVVVVSRLMFPRIGLINDPRACCRFTRRVPGDIKQAVQHLGDHHRCWTSTLRLRLAGTNCCHCCHSHRPGSARCLTVDSDQITFRRRTNWGMVAALLGC
jgi:hypothetical protein